MKLSTIARTIVELLVILFFMFALIMAAGPADADEPAWCVIDGRTVDCGTEG